MSFEVGDIFPNVSQGMSNIGFVFGSGASLKAGYPLLPKLTTLVLDKLASEQLDLLNSLVVKKTGRSIEKSLGEPNIEAISDILEESLLAVDNENKLYPDLLQVRLLIRTGIVEIMLSVSSPNISDHVRFFEAMKRIFSGNAESIWIFTTNYDTLFERAAAIAQIPLVNGFVGTSFRYFSIDSLNLEMGTLNASRFTRMPQPVIRLIKLHGSLDWWKTKSSVYSFPTDHGLTGLERVMILPRKRKVVETLEVPFGDIFRYAENMIGTRCKYLVSCGYGYGDEHINSTLFLPKLQNKKIRLTAFVKSDCANLDPFRKYSAFSLGTEDSCAKLGDSQPGNTDLWQFEKLIDLLCNLAGT